MFTYARARRASFVSIALVVALGTGACGSSSPTDDAGTQQTEGRKGYTQCAGETCNPGTYCDIFCNPGCASVTNCADGETCEKSGSSKTGTCKATTSVPTSECSKMPGFDTSCSGAGLPPKAYKCPVGGAAPQTQCVAAPNQKTYPGGWCCPN